MNSIAGRMDFDIAVQLFKNAFAKGDPGFDPVSAFRLTQSRLRLEQPITATTTSYTFPVLVNIQNQGNAFNTEVRLNLQDSFVPTHVGIYVAKPSGATDATYPLYTWFNPFIFTNAAAMNVLYNGVFKIMINNVQYVNNWPLLWHKNVPETQQTAALASGFPADEFFGDSYGKVPMQPFVLLIGSQNIQINVQLPVAPATVDANSRLIVVFDGVLAQNSTVVS